MRQRDWTKIILTPFSWVYGLITDARNYFYDSGLFSSHKPSQFTISVGNITVGGTGKTPMVEFLAHALAPNFNVSILSRGYGRKTTGFLLAGAQASAETIGDEPMQYHQKFSERIPVAVCEKRVVGAREIQRLFPENNLLLLDDAYQHRAIGRNINLLLSDYSRPFYHDLPFPAGRLRETRGGAKRADAIIVTKSPYNLSSQEKEAIRKNIRLYSRPSAPIFFASIEYGEAICLDGASRRLNNVKIVTGLAQPAPFVQYVSTHFTVIDQIHFPDHYNYQATDLKELIGNLKNGTFVLTTEKDMVKLKPLAEELRVSDRLAYIPIQVSFGAETGEFNDWLANATSSFR